MLSSASEKFCGWVFHRPSATACRKCVPRCYCCTDANYAIACGLVKRRKWAAEGALVQLAMMLNAELRRRLYVDCRQWFQTLLTSMTSAAVVRARRDWGHPHVVGEVLTSADRRRRSLLLVVAIQHSLTGFGQVDEAQAAAGRRRRGRGTTGWPGTLIYYSGSQQQAVGRRGRAGLEDTPSAMWRDWIAKYRWKLFDLVVVDGGSRRECRADARLSRTHVRFLRDCSSLWRSPRRPRSFQAFLAAVFVDEDKVRGRSCPEMIHHHPTSFIRYRWTHGNAHRTKFDVTLWQFALLLIAALHTLTRCMEKPSVRPPGILLF